MTPMAPNDTMSDYSYIKSAPVMGTTHTNKLQYTGFILGYLS